MSELMRDHDYLFPGMWMHPNAPTTDVVVALQNCITIDCLHHDSWHLNRVRSRITAGARKKGFRVETTIEELVPEMWLLSMWKKPEDR